MVEGRFQPGLGPEHSNTGEIIEAQQAELNTLRERLGDPITPTEPIRRQPAEPVAPPIEKEAPRHPVASTPEPEIHVSLSEILTHPEDADPADMQAAVEQEIFNANKG